MPTDASLKQLLELYQRERQLAAYELHDGLAQFVAGAQMHLEAAARFYPTDLDRSSAEFAQGMKLLGEAVHESRRLIDGLRPPLLDEGGVIAALERMIATLRHTGLDVAFSKPARFPRLAPPLETALFRITQEALTNIRRHSGVSRAQVELLQTDHRVRLTIHDQGAGFDADELDGRRIGLQGIHERARLLGGQAIIDSQPGGGTTITVELPLIEQALSY